MLVVQYQNSENNDKKSHIPYNNKSINAKYGIISP